MTDRDHLLRVYRERVESYPDAGEDYRDRWRKWCAALLANGGELVVPPMRPEPDLDLLLAEARLQPQPTTELALSTDCHANVAQLWADAAVHAVGTGYALKEGLWRQHSWAVDEDGAVRETKSRHERYVGCTLPAGESTVLFVLSNYPGEVRTLLTSGTDRATEIIRVLKQARARRPEDG